MNVLFVHNYYRSSAPSGEDTVARNEIKLLKDNGVTVSVYEKYNDYINESSIFNNIRLALNTVWSRRAFNETLILIKKKKPDVAHIHSIHPQISPSVYAACQKMGLPVVHTLHNYRYICPGALLLRNGKPCEDCVGRWPIYALRHRCYRGSYSATGALVAMIIHNRLKCTLTNQVNRYIALTEFAKTRFVAGGLPADRIEIKPNFLPQVQDLIEEKKRYAVYVGRLGEGKGLKTLLSAWRNVKGMALKIAGDGYLRAELESTVREQSLDIEFMGALPQKEVLSLIRAAKLQVVPSECYEGFPMVILEAYACGTPVVASRIGSLAEIVHNGETGLHFEAGNHVDLAEKINALASDDRDTQRMGARAREIYLKKYTPAQNFQTLIGIYKKAQDDFDMRRTK